MSTQTKLLSSNHEGKIMVGELHFENTSGSISYEISYNKLKQFWRVVALKK